jgi:hypothetical protein
VRRFIVAVGFTVVCVGIAFGQPIAVRVCVPTSIENFRHRGLLTAEVITQGVPTQTNESG